MFPWPFGDRWKLSNPRGSSSSAPKWRWTEDIALRHEAMFPGALRGSYATGDPQSGGWQGHHGPTAGMLYKGRRGDKWWKNLKDELPNHAVRRANQVADDHLARSDWAMRPLTTLSKGIYGLDVASAIRYRAGGSYDYASGTLFGGGSTAFGGQKSLFNPGPRDGFTGGFTMKPGVIYGAPRPGVPDQVLIDMATQRAKSRVRFGTPTADIPVKTAADPRSSGLDAKSLLLLAGVLGVVWLMRGRLA